MMYMDEAKTISSSAIPQISLWERVRPILVITFQFAALIILVVYPFLAMNWFKLPFIGMLVKPDLTVVDIEPANPGDWEAISQGTVLNSLTEIDGTLLNSTQQLQEILSGYQVGDTVEILVQARSGHTFSVEISLQTLPKADRVLLFYTPLGIGIIYLATGLWVMRQRRGDGIGRAFGLFSASTALLLAGVFDIFTSHKLPIVWTMALGLASGGIFHLALVFPSEHRVLNRASFLRWVGYILGISLAIPSIMNLNDLIPYQLDASWQRQLFFLGFSILAFLVGAILRRFTSPSPIEQEQTRILLWGIGISFLPVIIWLAVEAFSMEFLKIPLYIVIVPLAAFPLSIAYAILRYRMVNTDVIISQAIIYTVLTAVVAVGYGLLISGLNLVFNEAVAVDNPFLVGLLVFALALMLNPFRKRVQAVVDSLFFRGEDIDRQLITAFGDELSQVVELSEIAALLRKYIEERFQPVRLHIFVYDQLIDRYVATEDEANRPTTDIRFSRNSGLLHILSGKQAALYLNPEEPFPDALRTEKPRLALLGAQMFIALPGQENLSGCLALGPRKTGAVYTSQDMSFLNTLAEQAAQAIERAQVMADKDRRVTEMNVLTRVAQGVNVTLNFDDILELLYAQTRQVIPADDFNITLYNSSTNTLRHAFLLENDERLRDKEEDLIPLGFGLEREVLQARRYIITDDYEQECRNRRVISTKKDVFAWMGVPLNAGAEIIGVIVVASRNPAVLYTDDQYNILQAIADQAAGAIVKARLLDESEKRARQLASLNEVTRSLTSTLELDPLLNTILGSAVEILNCEAGSLLTMDEETGELVYEVVISPVADQFLGKRQDRGVGLTGKAAEEKKPLIVNNVETSTDWDSTHDQETGFVTRGMLIVPMVYKDSVIGVILVLNKKDNTPFDLDDQELLTAFASQAAVAVENVRLYTQTDEELSSRVEELSVMQRIDRELNTSLDVSRAMTITLEWAMRQSASDAGLIGVIEDEGLRVVASEGYDHQLDDFEDGIIPLDLPIFREALSDVRVQRMDTGQLVMSSALLTDALSQLVIPIRREAEVIGLLLLEGLERDVYDESSVSFLTRLSDHASISISNAQLYAEVQRANVAKSDFVSFVSHELKTPMTSIKGYSDLLSSGAVGEVTDAQTEFLLTIRSNIDRMATLVSDLADVSRIEAGRLHLEFASVNISEIVDEVVRSAQRMFEEKNHNVVIDIPKNLTQAWGDRNRLAQILTNLLSNANKYTPEGGKITIVARQTENQWDEEGAPQVVHVSVIDSGIGIKLDDQRKIFTQYFRTDEGKETAPGTGLGLNITRYLVEMQGGKIWFESVFGEGTTFQFTIPISESSIG